MTETSIFATIDTFMIRPKEHSNVFSRKRRAAVATDNNGKKEQQLPKEETARVLDGSEYMQARWETQQRFGPDCFLPELNDEPIIIPGGKTNKG